MKKTLFFALCGLSVASSLSCRRKSEMLGSKSGGGLSEIGMALPEKAQFTADVNLQAKLTGYRLRVLPSTSVSSLDSSATCTTNDEGAQTWSSSSNRLSQTLRQGCSYNFDLELGTLASGSSVFPVFYKGSESLLSQTIGVNPNVSFTLKIRITDEGKAAGFSSTTVTTPMPPAGESNVTITVLTVDDQLIPTPIATPSSPAPSATPTASSSPLASPSPSPSVISRTRR